MPAVTAAVMRVHVCFTSDVIIICEDLSNCDTQIRVIGSMSEICTKTLRNWSEKFREKYLATTL